MSEGDLAPSGGDAANAGYRSGEDDPLEGGSDAEEDSESEEDSDEESEDAGCDESDDASDKSNRAYGLVDYAMGYEGRVTLKGLHKRIKRVPADIVEEKFTTNNVLHNYVASNDGEVSLETVEYLLQLAPEAAKRVSDRHGLHPLGEGALPLHLALFNANCPLSVVNLLLKMNPPAVTHSWKEGYGLPLHCYMARALKHYPQGEWDYENGYFDEWAPAYPTGDLDHGMVKVLIEAHPEALTDISGGRGTPLHLLCQGRGVTLPFAKLLTDTERKCLTMGTITSYSGGFDNERLPIRSLLYNKHVDPFPTAVFQYLLEGNPSSLTTREDEEKDARERRSSFDFVESPLNLACRNPNMTAETIQLILNACPEMIKARHEQDGCLPLHTLCKNGGLNEQTSMEILKLLVNRYPKAAQKRTGKAGIKWIKDEAKYPIHIACIHKTVEFCKALVKMNPESVSKRAIHYPDAGLPRGRHVLPFHLACIHGSLDLVKFLLEKEPQALKKRTHDDCYQYDELVGYHTLIEVDDHNSSLLKKGDLPLHLAVSRKNCPEKSRVIDFLLQQDQSAASKVGTWGYLPLHEACTYHASLDAVRKILDSHPAAIHAKNVFGELPIHVLVRFSDEDNFDCLQYLAEQYPGGLGVIDSRGLSCAHHACTSDNALQKLNLVADIFPDALRRHSKEQGLPIHYACKKKCSVEVVEFLADQFPESLAADLEPIGLPLHCAAERETKDEHDGDRDENWKSSTAANRLVDMLLGKRYNSNFEEVEEEGEPTLPIYHLFLSDESIKNKDSIISRLRYAPKVNRDEEGRYLPHLIFGATRDFKLLKDRIDCGPIDKRDNHGWLPIQYALRHNAPLKIIQYMIEEHQDIDIQEVNLLHIACQYGCSFETIEMLVTYDPGMLERRGECGHTVLHAACSGGCSFEAIEMLVNYDPDLLERTDECGCTVLHTACSGGCSRETIRMLVNYDQYGMLERTDARGCTVLHAACSGGCSLETIEMLADLSVPELLEATDECGCTALHAACGGHASLDVIAYLLGENEDAMTMPDKGGEVPFHKACRSGNIDVIRFLMERDMDLVSMRNSRGELPVLLLCNGADKSRELLESTEYVGAIFNLLMVYPETVLVQCPKATIVPEVVERVKEFYANHPEIKSSHGWKGHVSVVFEHTKKALLSLEQSLSPKDAMEIELAALLHDVDDRKYFPDTCPGTYPNAKSILESVGIRCKDDVNDGNDSSSTSHERMIKMISWVGCSENGNSVPEEIKEHEAYHMLIPRWADRLEAVGARGVVRCYQYNQELGMPLWSEASPRPASEEELWSYARPERLVQYMDRGGTSTDMVSHYYDKLLHIARPPRDIVRNPYLEEMAESSSKDLVDVCLRFGRSGEVDEEHILKLMNGSLCSASLGMIPSTAFFE